VLGEPPGSSFNFRFQPFHLQGGYNMKEFLFGTHGDMVERGVRRVTA